VNFPNGVLAVWKYSEASVSTIFGDSLGDPDADRILRELTQKLSKSLTTTEVHKIFSGHRTSEQIEVAIQCLQKKGKIDRHTEKTNGRRIEYIIAY